MAASQSISKKSQKPTYSRFNQQELPACKPILTPSLVVQIVYRYDDICIPAFFSSPYVSRNKRIGYIQDPRSDKTCVRTLMVPKKMKQPIFVYYQIDQFYQNHRRYVKSRNDEQYRSFSQNPKTTNCEPETTTDDHKPIIPCGLIAWSLFNDTYTLSRRGITLPINKTNIAWKSDKEHKFSKHVYPQNFQTGPYIGGGKLNWTIPLSEQEDLLVWMRPAAVPSFRKLYGRIETDLEANDMLRVVIENNYNTYTFSGKKKLILSTTTWIGGKCDFMGLVYILVGGVCLLIAILYIIVYLIKPR
ncbi:hypothetical protein BUALT_Bualt06G0128200 [Buddleja alternifolia]|uniref:ALA-interacting subunit n=1 Tax=Buddleja alternifolia TaxID=168488 RepID=A0AAV6XMP9_9LAMI|nr:hypothetical protein BUALT_Bualt06G0128200 [Buddleja alternifolia]